MTQETRKIVINTRYGGFSLSGDAQQRVEALFRAFHVLLGVVSLPTWATECAALMHFERSHPFLIFAVETAQNPNSTYSRLKIVEIPADVAWQIDEYDGKEWVSEVHRTWD